MTEPAAKPQKCSNCERGLVPGRFWTCDEQGDCAWCDACFAGTACAAGVHGEGCATLIWDDGKARA